MARTPCPAFFSRMISGARPSNVFGLPSRTPRSLAAAKPALTLSRMIPRSNSATAISTASWTFPHGLDSLVSILRFEGECHLHQVTTNAGFPFRAPNHHRSRLLPGSRVALAGMVFTEVTESRVILDAFATVDAPKLRPINPAL